MSSACDDYSILHGLVGVLVVVLVFLCGFYYGRGRSNMVMTVPSEFCTENMKHGKENMKHGTENMKHGTEDMVVGDVLTKKHYLQGDVPKGFKRVKRIKPNKESIQHATEDMDLDRKKSNRHDIPEIWTHSNNMKPNKQGMIPSEILTQLDIFQSIASNLSTPDISKLSRLNKDFAVTTKNSSVWESGSFELPYDYSDEQLESLCSGIGKNIRKLTIEGDVKSEHFEKIIDSMTHLKVLVFQRIYRRISLESNDLQNLVRLRELEELDLGDISVNEAGFTHLASLNGLKRLVVNVLDRDASTEAAHVLKGLKHVTHIGLNSMPISIDDIPHLPNFQLLKGIELKYTEIDDPCLQLIFSKCESLTRLDIARCEQITHEGMQYIKNLKYLSLDRCLAVTNEGLKYIQENNKVLEHLSLKACNRITDPGLSELRHLPALKYLSLSENYQLTDKGIDHLKVLQKLEYFDLRGCSRVTSRNLINLSLANIRHLDLSFTEVGKGLSNLKDLRHIKQLHLEHTKITDEDMTNLSNIKSIEQLYLWNCKNLTDQGLKFIKGCKDLWILMLDDTSITDKTIQILECKDIRIISVRNCNGVTDESVSKLTNFHRLERLIVTGTSITENGVEKLKNKLPGTKIS